MNKAQLIETIRSVPIANKTYEEYVEAVAERLESEIACTLAAKFSEAYRLLLELVPVTKNMYMEAENEQRKADCLRDKQGVDRQDIP